MGSRGAPRLLRGGPSSAPAPTGPPGQARSARKGGGREPRWRTDERGSSYRAPGWRGRGVAAFVPGDLLPLRGEAEGASERPGRPGLGEGARWLWVSDASHLSNLTQKGDAEMYKVCLRKAVRDPAGGRPRRPPPAAGKRKAEEIRQGRGGGAAEGR